MPIKLEDLLSQLPPAERQEIEDGALKLIEEEATLRELREVRKRSQDQIAKKLGINQAAVSKMERRADMYVSTLRSLVEAMGGQLDVVARFPDRPPVRITQFHPISGELA